MKRWINIVQWLIFEIGVLFRNDSRLTPLQFCTHYIHILLYFTKQFIFVSEPWTGTLYFTSLRLHLFFTSIFCGTSKGKTYINEWTKNEQLTNLWINFTVQKHGCKPWVISYKCNLIKAMVKKHFNVNDRTCEKRIYLLLSALYFWLNTPLGWTSVRVYVLICTFNFH